MPCKPKTQQGTAPHGLPRNTATRLVNIVQPSTPKRVVHDPAPSSTSQRPGVVTAFLCSTSFGPPMRREMRLLRSAVASNSTGYGDVKPVASTTRSLALRSKCEFRPYVHGLTQHLRLPLEGFMKISGFRDSKGGKSLPYLETWQVGSEA